jgi:beta-mannosidase
MKQRFDLSELASMYGKGQHWDVHGPWKVEGKIEDYTYWENDDALFRSEVGAPGPSSAEIIRRYKGECDELPGTMDNPLWRRTSWWIEWPQFVEEHGREPNDLEEYVAWGQDRQARALRMAAEACKGRFPAIGGILLWMGHDCFPCASNTAIIDFEGNPKPAAIAYGEALGR